MENRNGPIVDGRLGEANGTAEREEAETMVAAIPGRDQRGRSTIRGWLDNKVVGPGRRMVRKS